MVWLRRPVVSGAPTSSIGDLALDLPQITRKTRWVS